MNDATVIVFAVETASGDSESAVGELMAAMGDALAAVEGIRLTRLEKLAVEDALTLQDASLALFITESDAAPTPFAMTELTVDESQSMAAENGSLTPEQLLHTYASLRRNRPRPPTFLLELQSAAPDRLESVAAAAELLGQLTSDLSPQSWRSRLS